MDTIPLEDRRTPPGEGQPKRLFKITEGAMLFGVCNGLALYFGTDASIVRVLFVIFTLLTQGGGIVVYLVLAVLVPTARTPDDFASARGDKPNPYGVERRQGDPGEVNSRAYWEKLFNDQKEYWKKFAKKHLG